MKAMKQLLLPLAIVIFVGTLALSWITHGTGIIRNDPERHIWIPQTLTVPLQVKAAYNGQTISFRYRWPADRPGMHHDVITFRGGRWVRQGGNVPGSQPQGLAEDRIAMMVDDGSVPEFARYGGYVAIAPGMVDLSDQATPAAVRAHPYLGGQLRQAEVSKFLPATRRNPGDWTSVVPAEELAGLRRAGYFLDLWHWRGHRSSPIGYSDDQYVFVTRGSDTGRAPYGDNWDGQQNRPRFMFDPAKAGGRRAYSWNDLMQGRLGFDDLYYVSTENSVPFDPNHAWQEGDTIPRRLLQTPDRSRGDIRVAGQGRWANGFWEVTLRRAMDTGNPADDKIFVDRRVYNLAFAVHRNASGSRWHYVSLPVSLGVGRDAELVATRHEGEEPRWEQPWHNVTLFYPGQVSWPLVNSSRHAGAENIRRGVPVRARHTEEQLAHYGIEVEFADPIRRQWQFTLWAGVLLIFAFGAAMSRLLARTGE